MTTNLPYEAPTAVVLVNGTTDTPLEFAANDYQLTKGFFEENGFASDAAIAVANTILEQAKAGYIYTISADGLIQVSKGTTGPTPVFKILDTLKAANNALTMSLLVGAILNNNRGPTSVLGFKKQPTVNTITRNIAP